MWLSLKNLYTDRPYKKLDNKILGPFKVVEKRGSLYKLDLPNTIKVHPVFLVVLLFKDPDNALLKQVNEPPPPINIEGELEYEVEEILALRKKGRQL